MNITDIAVTNIYPFEGHPFRVREDTELEALTQSIRSQGILTPLILRPREDPKDTYEIVSGHRRFRAAVKAGMESVPALICDMDRDAAAIALVDSNLHREHLLPSEKAFAYKLKADAMKRYVKANLGQVVPNYDTTRVTAEIGEQMGESYKTVQRYIRLTNLLPPLLDLVDEGRIENVLNAIQMGILTASTKERLEQLEARRDTLKTGILQAQMERPQYSRDEIVAWISRFRHRNLHDPDYRREIIDTFVNAVYVYDDRIVFTYNFKDGCQTTTLAQIEAAFGSDLEQCAPP